MQLARAPSVGSAFDNCDFAVNVLRTRRELVPTGSIILVVCNHSPISDPTWPHG